MMAHVTSIANAVGVSVQVQKLDDQHPMAPALHPGKRVGFYLQQEGKDPVSLGWCGEFHPKVKRSYEITVPCFAFEINLSVLMQNLKSHQQINTRAGTTQRFPSITRDFAFLLDDKVTSKELNDVVLNSIQEMITSVIPANLSEVKIFDIYKGVEPGKKSVAFKVTIEPIQKTFTDADIQKISSQIVQAIGKNLNGELRGV
jgi:phenylalanyl-tRNA synthetase beta chain